MDYRFYKDIQFATDLPATSDEFPTGAHQRVADTLVDIITSGEGGRAIGLEGTWGSGKSTVIDFALSKFKKWNEDNKLQHSVFVFDAWAHQGDPLRRSFLEELIAALAASSKNIINKSYWTDELERLRSKRKQTTETKAEKLSLVARIALMALPLYPLAYFLILQGEKDGASTISIDIPFLTTITFSYQLWSGILLVAAPYLAAAATWLAWRKGFPFFSSDWYLPKHGKEGKSVMMAFNRQTDQVVTDQLVKEDEATSIEFNLVFDKLMNEAKSNNHRVIIVLDNLDRLSNEQIREVWAIMRNFFAATPGSERRETLKNVWLIVPIDRHHIKSVFADGKGQEPDQTTTRGFIEKTFEIVLRVPPPLLSNWQAFLKGKLTDSFKEKISPQEIYKIFRFFELYQTSHPSIITPRTIKAYVNKIVGQAKLVGDLIPLEFQALFVLYKDQIEREFTKLQDSTILDATVRAAVNDSAWTKYLAAAYFNVPPDEALEILLTRDIEKELLEHNPERLAALQKTRGFDIILHSLLATKASLWAGENPAALFEIIATLDHLTLADTAAQIEIWREFSLCLQKIDKAIVPAENTSAAIKALIHHNGALQSENIARELVSVLSIDRIELPGPADAAGVAWFKLVEAVAETLKEEKDEAALGPIFSAIKIPPNVQYLLGVAEAASQSALLSLRNFEPLNTLDEISNAIVALIQNPAPPNSLEAIIAAFLETPKHVNWKAVVAATQTRLQQNTPPLIAVVARRLISLLRTIETTQEPAKAALKAINDDGSLHGLMELGRREKNNELMASAIYELINQRDGNLAGNSEHPHYGQLQPSNELLTKIQISPEAEPELLDSISKISIETGGFWKFLTLSLPAEKQRNLYRILVARLIESDGVDELVISDVLTNFDRVSEILSAEQKSTLLKNFDRFEIANDISDQKWMTIQPSFLIASNDIRTKHFRTIRDAIRGGLPTLSSEQWAEALDKENNTLHLLFSLIDLKAAKTLDAVFFDALRSHAARLIDGAPLPTRFASSWPELVQLLSPSHREQFYKSVRDQLVNKAPSVKIIQQILSLYGKEFSENCDLPNRDDVIRTIIEPLVTDASDESLSSLEIHSKAFGKTIKRASDSDRQFLTERFTTLYINAAPERTDRIRAVSDMLGVELPELAAKEEPVSTAPENEQKK